MIPYDPALEHKMQERRRKREQAIRIDERVSILAKFKALSDSIRKEDIGDGTAEYFADQIERIAKEGT